MVDGLRWQFCDVKVKASCGAEACTVSAKGKLTKGEKDKLWPRKLWAPGDEQLDPGKTTKILLHLTLRTRKQALKALKNGKKVRTKITVRGKDAAGNVETAKRTIRLVK